MAPEPKPLRVLLVEDAENDAMLVVHALRRAGYAPTWLRVDTAAGMAAALAQPWQLVLADHSLPSFSAPAAFAMVRERGLDLPFIIISGHIGEEAAVEAMRAGVHDYLLKDRLARLGPAVERELREAARRVEQRRLHEQLLIADRLAQVGTLAAGVAHEINNPLAALMANLDFVGKELARLVEVARDGAVGDEPLEGRAWATWLGRHLDEAAAPLRDAQLAAERVRKIVRDVKIFARGEDEERRGEISIERVLDSSLRMASNEIRHRARLDRAYAGAPAVWADEARLGQLFLNLIINAAQAIPAGRTEEHVISVSAKASTLDAAHVDVEIRDTGVGIAPELLPRIFDPFFTTKPVGVGTGLGLPISHRIVSDLGGTLEVESSPGKGTRVRVTLPVATPAAAVATRPEAPTSKRRGRLLLVDDDEMILTILRRVLTREHEVHAVTEVREALRRLDAGERFDVILCDLMMPQMTGVDFYLELHARDAAQAERIVFMTGGAFAPSVREFIESVPNERVEKPFDIPRLLGLVQRLLGSPRGHTRCCGSRSRPTTC
jgi:signal transduction histidine kinase